MHRPNDLDLKKSCKFLVTALLAVPVKFIYHSCFFYFTLPLIFGTKFEPGFTLVPAFIAAGMWCASSIFYISILPLQLCRHKISMLVLPPDLADQYELKRRKTAQAQSEKLLSCRSVLERVADSAAFAVRSAPRSLIEKFALFGLASLVIPQIFTDKSPATLAEYSLLFFAADTIFSLLQVAVLPANVRRDPTQTTNDLENLAKKEKSFSDVAQEMQELGAIKIARHDFTIELNPSAQAYLDRAKTYLDSGNAIVALNDYDRAIELQPDFAEAYEFRAKCFVALGLKSLARTDYLKAAQLLADQNNLTQRETVMEALSDLGTQSSADLKSFKDIISTVSVFFTGDLKKINQIKFEKVETDIKSHTQTYLVYTRKAELQFQLTDYKGALETCEQAIELNPSRATAYRIRAKVRLLKGDDVHAVLKDYDKTIELSDKDAEAYEERARLRVVLGDFQGAIEDCTNAMQFSESGQLKLVRASALVAMEKYDDALADLNTYIHSANRAIVIWDGLKLSLFRSVADGLRTQLLEAYEMRSIVHSRCGNLDGAAHDAIELQKIRNHNEKSKRKNRKSLLT